MRQMRRALALLLAALSLTSALQLPVQAASVNTAGTAAVGSEHCGIQAEWTLTEDGTLSITGTGRMNQYSAENPAPWADAAAQVRKVKLSAGMTSVGSCAFAGCRNLKTVSLPEGLKNIGSCAFLGCVRLKRVEVPEQVTRIQANAFGYELRDGTLSPVNGLILAGGTAAEVYAGANPHVGYEKAVQAPENPTVTGLTTLERGVNVQWKAVSGARRYKVYYRQQDGAWKSAGATASTSMKVNGLVSGKKYAFAVTSLWTGGEGKVQASKGKSIFFVAAPVIKSVSAGNSVGTVQVKWNAVAGAVRYRVYYKIGSGNWRKAGDTTSTSFLMKQARIGTAYSFTVRCVSADGRQNVSAYSATGSGLTLTETPVITRAESVNGGVCVRWARSAGAVKYRVFYKVGTKWVKAGDTTGTSLLVRQLRSNTAYTFTVRCITADGKRYTSSLNNKGVTHEYLAAPVLKSVEAVATGVEVSWHAVPGVSRYRVFYKTSGGWKKAGDTSDTSFVVENLTGGQRYSFTVRGMTSKGKSVTGYDNVGLSLTYVAAPVLKQVLYDDNGITVTWEASVGAARYRVFYQEGSEWVALGDTTDTFYYTTRLDTARPHTFTVRCVSADGSEYTSGYDQEGIAPLYIPGKPFFYDFSDAYASGRFYRQLMSLHLDTDPRENLVQVAMSQLGYTEGNRYGQWDGTSGGEKNYTEFGLWYTNHVSDQWEYYAGAWCCMFVSWCANEANIPASVIPRRALVEDMDDAFGSRYYTWNETACGYGSKRIQKGDLIIYSASAGGRLSHIGIVTGVTYSGDRCVISTVEGNVDDACRTRRFIMTRSSGGRVDGDHYIRGFCCPNY